MLSHISDEEAEVKMEAVPGLLPSHVSLLSPAWCGRMGLGQVGVSK